MRKFLGFALILTVAMAFGCGKKEEGPKKENKSVNKNEAAAAESVKREKIGSGLTYLKYAMNSTAMGNSVKGNMEMYIDKDKYAMSMDMNMPGAKMRMVFDIANAKAIMFMDDMKTYSEMDIKQLEKMSSDMGINTNMDPSKFLKPTGQKKKISGWNCEKYEIDMSAMMKKPEADSKAKEGDMDKAMADMMRNMFKDMKMSMWVTKDVPKEIIDRMNELNEMMKKIPGMKSQMTTVDGGIAVRIEMSMGQLMDMKMDLKELKNVDKAPAKVFDMSTEGYNKSEMPTRPKFKMQK